MRSSSHLIPLFAAFSLLLAACAPLSFQSSLGDAPALAGLAAGFIRRPVKGDTPTAADVSYYPKPPAPDKTHAQINRQIGLPGDPVTQAIFAFLDKLN
jgi:hypothetical protein